MLTTIAAPLSIVALATALLAYFLARGARAAERRASARVASLETFAARAQTQTERDRAEIARDMHDQLGGLLVAAKMDLDGVARRLGPADEAARAKLAQVSASLDSGLAMKRRLVERLRPSILDHLGLFAALQWQLSEMCTAAGLECTAQVPDADPGYAADAAIVVYRLGHDAIARAIAAAEVSLIELDANVVADALELKLTDDGANAVADPAQAEWLWALNHRAEGLGGSCRLERRPDGGTRLHLRIPTARLAGASPC